MEGSLSSTLKKFDKVQEASINFDDYLSSVLGMGHSDRTRDCSFRKDDWESEHKSSHRKEHVSSAYRCKKTQQAENSESSEDDDIGSDGSRRSDSSQT
jgi:hypothetical protein